MINAAGPLTTSASFPGGEYQSAHIVVETKQAGVPYPARVVVLDRRLPIIFWSGKTNANGELRVIVPFVYASKNDLVVLAVEDTGTYNAVIADNVRAEPSP